ncbi:hypothetical protein GYMLUDRAFT_44397 [Collybiopsis luxurians FD-317 M1]|uniref:Uncharacterized protein n=1 Tax=Collybiopsis luxurians FD-317 M1 TaxID=944289 RepID=A0A0D0CMN5_9AGAR|nr:hypothetical protein GYMLUDRAFT_44397 [Collybiopsis luxurians FD-317 M1]
MQRPYRPRLSLHSQSLSVNTDFLSKLGTIPAEVSASTPTSPLPDRTLAQVRRKTVAGNLANWGPAHEYEERIALLEAQNSRISGELKATRDALVDERENRRIERQSVLTSAPSRSSTHTDHDNHVISDHSEILYERKLRMEILDSLKKVRAQNMSISRSLRESQDNYASLSSVLEAEQREKDELREEIKKLSMRNFTLFEHNKLLVSRDSALQDEISSLMTKSQADDWMRGVLEQELQKFRQGSPLKEGYTKREVERGPTPAITLEHQGPLRAQLVAARDELHIARKRLEASEKKSEELESRVSNIQRNMSQCLDSSAKALEVERELRAEVEEYARTLEEENARLKESTAEHGPVIDMPISSSPKSMAGAESSSCKATLFSESPAPHRILCGDVQKVTVDVRNVTLSPIVYDSASIVKSQVTFKARRRERLLERQLRLSNAKKTARRRSSLRLSRSSALFSSVSSPAVTDVPIFQSFALTPPLSPTAPIVSDSADAHPSTPPPTPPSTPPRRPRFPSNPDTHGVKRDSSALKPLRLSMFVSPERLGQHGSPQSRFTAPSPILPPVPPATPKKQDSLREKRRQPFRSDTGSTTNYPDTPYSSVSTLVAPSPAPASTDKGKSLILATTLSKQPSFDAILKASTTLFLDNRADREETRLPSPTTTKTTTKFADHATQMRRASALLASIAKSTGIGSLEDWFVV